MARKDKLYSEIKKNVFYSVKQKVRIVIYLNQNINKLKLSVYYKYGCICCFKVA